MKNLVFCLFLIIFSFPLSAQKGTLPKKIAATFNQKYPGVDQITWDVEKGDYKIKFIQNGKRTTVDIGQKGSWEKTSVHLAFEELPKNVQSTVNTTKKNSTLDEIKKVTDNDGETYYRIEIINGDQKTKLDVAEDGTIIKLNTSTKK